MAAALAAGLLGLGAGPAHTAETRPGLQACWLPGLEHAAWCGTLQRPLDPAQPQGRSIELHYAVLPALARNRKPDPIVFFAGGPGQSAMDLAGQVSRLLARLAYRRDIVLIDQRGTGRSAPLYCEQSPPTLALAALADPARQLQRLRQCQAQLATLPHGDLRQYTTAIAVQDAEAVRRALGAAQVNLVGVSYGTRVALDYARQFPAAVRRMVLDGAAPPDMVLPAAMSGDNQAALDAVLAACRADAACQGRHPALAEQWRQLLAALPQTVEIAHPVTGRRESVTMTRSWLLSLVRAPLYAPSLAAGLPLAISEAAGGRYEPLLGLATALAGRSAVRRRAAIAEGMHFAVVCGEDAPRLDAATDAPGPDFGSTAAEPYRALCAGWPRGDVPAAFYTMPPTPAATPAATLVLSGGADPVTPPRHGQRVAQALGGAARHVVVPQAGHGVLGLVCMRDVVLRFVDAQTPLQALAVDADCAANVPRPPAFAPVLGHSP